MSSRLFFIPLLAMAFAGCEAMQSGAPSVNAKMIAAATGDSVATLTTGRRLLAMRCTSCHALEPIAKYTPSEWKTNLNRMANRAGLDETEIRQISAYLIAARNSL